MRDSRYGSMRMLSCMVIFILRDSVSASTLSFIYLFKALIFKIARKVRTNICSVILRRNFAEIFHNFYCTYCSFFQGGRGVFSTYFCQFPDQITKGYIIFITGVPAILRVRFFAPGYTYLPFPLISAPSCFIRHEPEDAAVPDGAQRHRGDAEHIYAPWAGGCNG